MGGLRRRVGELEERVRRLPAIESANSHVRERMHERLSRITAARQGKLSPEETAEVERDAVWLAERLGAWSGRG